MGILENMKRVVQVDELKAGAAPVKGQRRSHGDQAERRRTFKRLKQARAEARGLGMGMDMCGQAGRFFG